jgi:enoyl-CoA hydratase/carnithine racemase
MSDAPVLYDAQDGIAVLTLNRPDNRNSMTPEVMDAFRDAVARASADSKLRVAIITGNGKSFCAGADFKSASPALQRDERADHERLYQMYEPFLNVFDLPIPTVGALNGHAIGGGFGLTLVCDIRVANRDARYGANFSRLGLHSGMAVSYLLPRIVGVPKAAELLFTGKLIDGAEAAEIGLAHQAVEADRVLEASMAYAKEIAAAAPEAVRLLKRSLYRGAGWQPRDAARLEAFSQAATMRMDDAKEGIRALLEKREPAFTGH